MDLFHHSLAEQRMLHRVSRRTIQDEALQAQKAHADATKASQPYAQYGGVNPDALKIQELVKTNFDASSATPQQIADQNRGMALAGSTTGTPRVAQAVTPNSLTTGARGIAGSTGGHGATKSPAQRIKEAVDSADNALVGANNLDTTQRLAARQQAEANVIAQVQAEQQAQAAAVAKANAQAVQGAAAAEFNPYGNRKSSAGISMNADVQAFVKEQRALGKSDAEIRRLVQAMPQDQTTPPTPTTPTNAPPSAQTEGTTTTTPVPTTTPKTTPPASTNTQAPNTTTGTKGADTTTNTNIPSVVGPTPASVAFRNMAALAVDPIEKLLMTSYADMIDATPAGGAPISFSDFMASADARSISQGYNDANSILSEYQETVKASTASRQKFSQDQFDRNDAYLASAQANAHAQLTFANDKAARDLAESNRKALNKASNLLSLQGGFGSAGGNLEVLEAQQKGEQAIVDLNKEFGFKHTDVSLQFTQMHNEAQDKFTSSWLDALDNFDAKIADIATQKNANETAKRAALKSAYSDRNKAVTDANLAHAKAINDATKGVTDFIKERNKDKIKESKSTGDKLSYISGLRKEIEGKKTIAQAKEVDGFVGVANVAYDRYTKLLKDIKDGKADSKALSPSQTAVVTSLAKILDPGSVVRNEEYERQSRGQGFVDRVTNLYDQFLSGSQFSPNQIEEMWTLANQIKETWGERLSEELQPMIMDIDDWNASYPDAQIKYEQVITNLDRVHLPSQTFSTWESQANTVTEGFSTTGGPSQGWRTDRHNNPIAFAVKANGTNEFTKALDNANIGWEYGDPFPENANMVTVKVLGDPVEGARAVLANSNALQNWYLGPRPYKKELSKFGIKNNQDFKALPLDVQNQVISTIYKGEVGNGSLVASIQPTNSTSSTRYSLVPQAEASDDDVIIIKGDEDGFKLEANVGPSSEKYKKEQEQFKKNASIAFKSSK